MISEGMASDEADAVELGRMLGAVGIIAHVVRDHEFSNRGLYFRFVEDEGHGSQGMAADGTSVSWADFLHSGWKEAPADTKEEADFAEEEQDAPAAVADQGHRPVLQPHLVPSPGSATPLEQDVFHQVQPMDDHNVRLLDHVHPREWQQPRAKTIYDLVVIGAGAGGLVSAAGAAGVGARVALIEEHLMGGDCLNVGCVPSKAIIRSAKLAAQLRDAEKLAELGISVEGTVKVDFGKVMERMRKIRSEIAEIDSAERFSKLLGVDVYLGRGRFTGKHSVSIDGEKEISFVKAVIATGGSPVLPDVPGLNELRAADKARAQPRILTNMNLFNLTSLPPRLGVIGSGAIGAEMAQAFQR